MQRAGPRIQGNAFGRAAIVSEFCFKSGHFGAEDELTAFQYASDGSINFRLDAAVLSFQIDRGDFSVRHEYCARPSGIASKTISLLVDYYRGRFHSDDCAREDFARREKIWRYELQNQPPRKPPTSRLLWATSPEDTVMSLTARTNLEKDLGFAERAAGP